MRRRRPAMRRLYAPAGLKRVAGRWRWRSGPTATHLVAVSHQCGAGGRLNDPLTKST